MIKILYLFIYLYYYFYFYKKLIKLYYNLFTISDSFKFLLSTNSELIQKSVIGLTLIDQISPYGLYDA